MTQFATALFFLALVASVASWDTTGPGIDQDASTSETPPDTLCLECPAALIARGKGQNKSVVYASLIDCAKTVWPNDIETYQTTCTPNTGVTQWERAQFQNYVITRLVECGKKPTDDNFTRNDTTDQPNDETQQNASHNTNGSKCNNKTDENATGTNSTSWIHQGWVQVVNYGQTWLNNVNWNEFSIEDFQHWIPKAQQWCHESKQWSTATIISWWAKSADARKTSQNWITQIFQIVVFLVLAKIVMKIIFWSLSTVNVMVCVGTMCYSIITWLVRLIVWFCKWLVSDCVETFKKVKTNWYNRTPTIGTTGIPPRPPIRIAGRGGSHGVAPSTTSAAIAETAKHNYQVFQQAAQKNEDWTHNQNARTMAANNLLLWARHDSQQNCTTPQFINPMAELPKELNMIAQMQRGHWPGSV